jgi:hypothetical protein
MTLSTLLVNGCLAGVLGQLLPMNCTLITRPQQIQAPPCDRDQQTGHPGCIAWWAIPSDTGRYTMYRVGGGCPCPRLAEPPSPCDGTWGWDYVGRCFHPHVILGWWHGLAYQGGTGSYKTDGPTLNHGEGTLGSLCDK